MSDRSAEKALDALYAELPSINCQGHCWTSCGPVRMSRVEWARILRRRPEATMMRPDGMCPLLTPGHRCGVYSNRPMLCRLWGLVEEMPCVYGCVPENGRLLSTEEGFEFLRRANELGA